MRDEFCSEAPARDVLVWSGNNVVLCHDGNVAPARANTECKLPTQSTTVGLGQPVSLNVMYSCI